MHMRERELHVVPDQEHCEIKQTTENGDRDEAIDLPRLGWKKNKSALKKPPQGRLPAQMKVRLLAQSFGHGVQDAGDGHMLCALRGCRPARLFLELPGLRAGRHSASIL